MTFLNKIPGPFLVFFGALCLSFGGLIVKSFEGANLWQILFWRQFFFAIIVVLYLLFSYRKNYLNFKKQLIRNNNKSIELKKIDNFDIDDHEDWFIAKTIFQKK